jgi:hypothetical protein
MKITDELVAVINGGLQDLQFEIELLEALERIAEGEERTQDELDAVERAVKAVGLTLENRSLELCGVLSNRFKTTVNNSEEAYQEYSKLANTINYTVQMDRVLSFVASQNVSKSTISEITSLKVSLVNDILAKLGIDLQIKESLDENI